MGKHVIRPSDKPESRKARFDFYDQESFERKNMDAKKILQRQREFDFNKVKTLDDLISVMRCLTLSIPMTDEQAEPIKHLLKDK